MRVVPLRALVVRIIMRGREILRRSCHGHVGVIVFMRDFSDDPRLAPISISLSRPSNIKNSGQSRFGKIPRKCRWMLMMNSSTASRKACDSCRRRKVKVGSVNLCANFSANVLVV
jgi:hypothetical protein